MHITVFCPFFFFLKYYWPIKRSGTYCIEMVWEQSRSNIMRRNLFLGINDVIYQS